VVSAAVNGGFNRVFTFSTRHCLGSTIIITRFTDLKHADPDAIGGGIEGLDIVFNDGERAVVGQSDRVGARDGDRTVGDVDIRAEIASLREESEFPETSFGYCEFEGGIHGIREPGVVVDQGVRGARFIHSDPGIKVFVTAELFKANQNIPFSSNVIFMELGGDFIDRADCDNGRLSQNTVRFVLHINESILPIMLWSSEFEVAFLFG
jgi:hypothetical protein